MITSEINFQDVFMFDLALSDNQVKSQIMFMYSKQIYWVPTVIQALITTARDVSVNKNKVPGLPWWSSG